MAETDIASLLDDPRARIGAASIDGQPAGEDLRDDPAYDELETEFRKMETAGPGSVDWKMLNEKSLDLIENRSKDLILGSRLAYGLYREEGYKGLAVGLSILNGMVAEHWEGLFPPSKRERGRAGSFDWLAEKLAPGVETRPPDDGEAAFALAAHDILIEIDDALSEKLTKHPVALGPLVRALRPHANAAKQAGEAQPAVPAETPAAAKETPPGAETQAPAREPAKDETVAKPPPPAEKAPPPPSAPSSSLSVPAVADIPTDEGADKALQSLFNAATKVASAVRQQAPHDPRAYLCTRLAVWGQIGTAPPDSAGKTALPPPPKARLDEIEALQAAGNGQGLLMTAESAFVSSPFWLDAQRIIVQAMQAAGSAYDGARAAVIGELGAFLQRVPGLTGLSFSDGRPFADSETLNWIGREVRGSDGAEGTAQATPLDAVKMEAEKLGLSGTTLDGLKLLTEHAEACFGERARFVAQLEIGEYCLRFEILQPLFSLLDRLRRTAENRALDKWEPALAVALANLSWRSVTHKGAKRYLGERESQEQKALILATLADLDIVAATRLSTDKGA